MPNLMSKKVFLSTVLLFMSGWIARRTEGISIYTFLLLRRRALAQQQVPRTSGNVRQRPQWGTWGQWSTCTSTVGMGVRVRSRPCTGASCERLPGDNYQLEQCNRRGGDTQNQNPEFLQKCSNDPNMRNTLSCKLYRENPSMAYNIFQSSGCLFNVIGDQGEDSDDSESSESRNDLVFGRPPDVRAGEVGLAFQNQLDTAPLSSGRFSEEGITPRNPPSALSVAASALLTSQLCTSACEAVVLRATGISRFGGDAPTTVSGVLQLLAASSIFRDNREAISGEYSSCLSACGVTGPAYGALRLNLLNRGQDGALRNPNLEVVLSIPNTEGTGSERRRRSTEERKRMPPQKKNEKLPRRGGNARAVNIVQGSQAERSLLFDIFNANTPKGDDGGSAKEQERIGMMYPYVTQQTTGPNYVLAKLEEPKYKKSLPTTAPSESTTAADIFSSNSTNSTQPTESRDVANHRERSRKKRQLRFPRPNRYRSPCFEREELSTNPRVLTIDDTESELFFYEGMEQRFLRRRCAGQSVFSNALFQAREQVTQARTGQLAVCKQGFLRRYGLLIQLDPEGEFAFSDGERFSVRFRPFKLESHCFLSTLQ